MSGSESQEPFLRGIADASGGVVDDDDDDNNDNNTSTINNNNIVDVDVDVEIDDYDDDVFPNTPKSAMASFIPGSS